jgi:dGTPase
MANRRERRRDNPADRSAAARPFADDRDRILHSAAFRRLHHVTQVMATTEAGQFHNRLTHTLAVARIGRSVAERMLRRPETAALAEAAGGLDATVVEAACLAHDLGHPPFAHVAESELDRLLTAAGVADGFEANAQSFRVVCALAGDGPGGPGLNLTRATLAAILKYPWLRHDGAAIPNKWGAYSSEAAELAWARELPPGSQEPTLEAALMDWADLVAYAVLDFEDFARAGMLPLETLMVSAAERERFLALVFARRRVPLGEQATFEAIFARLLAACPVSELPPTSRRDRNALRCFCQHQIDEAIGAVSLSADGHGDPALAIDPATKAKILLLEGLTWHYVIDSDLLVPQRDEQRRLIRGLFAAFAEGVTMDRGLSRLPHPFERRFLEAENDSQRLRIVCDCLALLTETEAIAIYQGIGNVVP